MTNNKFKNGSAEHHKHQLKKYLFLGLSFVTFITCAQNKENTIEKSSNKLLLDQYINAKGNTVIIFDSSNIKLFWIDKSVASKDDSILIQLKKEQNNESVPLKIQLANVNETQDCRIEVISETDDFAFLALNDKAKVLSSSEKENNYLTYSVASSVIHLEDTNQLSFMLKFSSKSADVLSIKKVILSFLNNKESSFLSSPGRIKYTTENINTSSKTKITDDNSFIVEGKNTAIYSSKKIITTNNTLSCSVTIKNTGNIPTNIYVGYSTFLHDKSLINGSNYPYKPSNKALKVLSSSMGDDKIIVDSNTEWVKGCHLVLNAKDDFSDIPNHTFVGSIVEVKDLENGQAEIVLDKPLKSELMKDTKVRVHGRGGSLLYTGYKTLQPGEQHTFTSTIQKDDSFLEYSPKAFSKGVYYVMPVILSYSADANIENSIQITDYTISY